MLVNVRCIQEPTEVFGERVAQGWSSNPVGLRLWGFMCPLKGRTQGPCSRWRFIRILLIRIYVSVKTMARRKLTLSVDEDAIKTARRYSKSHGTSVSELVTRYLGSLEDEERPAPRIVSRLRGILPSDVSIADYRRYIAEKHAK
jgi:hypothetical protein